MDFYDEIAEQYDEITGQLQRVGRAEAFIEELIGRYGIRSAIDAACGTGMYTLPLARRNVQTVGADISRQMISRAQAAGNLAAAQITWLVAPMQELSSRLEGKFDAVLCMGNSIPHLLENRELASTLEGFVKLTRHGGTIVLQLLNYAAVLDRQERIVGINSRQDRYYVRFYDFLPELVRFNILEFSCPPGQGCTHRLHSTMLRPYRSEQLRQAMLAAGCSSVELFGGLDFSPFDASSNETVMLVGRV